MDIGNILGSLLGSNSGSANTANSLNTVVAALTSAIGKKDEKGNIDWGNLVKTLAVTAGPLVVAQAISMLKKDDSEKKEGTSSLAAVSESSIANIASVAGLILQSLNSKK